MPASTRSPTRPTTAPAAQFFAPSIWPTVPPGLPGLWGAYLAAMQDLADRILGLMADALGLGPDFFAAMIDKPMASATVNRYPALTELTADQFRGGAHTDYGTITLLATDGVPGLQLQDADGEWVHVDPVPTRSTSTPATCFRTGAEGTGDRRGTGSSRRPDRRRIPSRTSIAYFHSPNADTVISPLPITVGSVLSRDRRL